ncbi:MAG: preprotein translocase subunit SecA [Acidobacteria bacterium]|nr:preprotein translocase subunit SecA [Acidobacteriota bacterium]
MIDALLSKIFGTKTEREIKRMRPLISAINDLEPSLQSLSDAELAARTTRFREQIAQGAHLDHLLVDAFATVREAGRRVLNMRHFDVQLIGGIVLHRGCIAEMKTGEGKTLVATLPSYLNALDGKGVHIVTVNDYLARRDAEWMGKIHRSLGLSVGIIVHGLDDSERKAAYGADITYATNNELGFDYLRDNMKSSRVRCAQRGHNYAIVDEVDSILIDEARTPLIISGASEESTDKYCRINAIIPKLIRGEVIEGKEPGEKYTTGDYTVDEKHRSAALTEEGVLKVERLLSINNLYDPANIELNHHVQQGLRAHVLFHRDKDYLVQNGEVVIVDEHTGRLMPGRRWSDGLHQAIEAKEGVKIERENQTLATVTFQNFFRLYKKLAGMTGTADTEAAEFAKTYKLDVIGIPTNRAMIRREFEDIVYRTEEEKFRNAVKEIKERHENGQPVLVGTISVEKSEKISGMLKRAGVRHEVLNAKNHEREAVIVAQAGRLGAVTVSTNMAGRGTDILLGGNPEFMTKDELRRRNIDPDAMQIASIGTSERQLWDDTIARHRAATEAERAQVVERGGLIIVGTERHDARRIDNQLRGRAGRQGDPGASKFFLSLQDDLLRIFGGERMQNLMLRLGMEEDVPIESRMITKRIAAAQKAVEAQNFAARKHLLEYDDVMNKQRIAVYGMRQPLMEGQEDEDRLLAAAHALVESTVDTFCPARQLPNTYNINGLIAELQPILRVPMDPPDLRGRNHPEVIEVIMETYGRRYHRAVEARASAANIESDLRNRVGEQTVALAVCQEATAPFRSRRIARNERAQFRDAIEKGLGLHIELPEAVQSGEEAAQLVESEVRRLLAAKDDLDWLSRAEARLRSSFAGLHPVAGHLLNLSDSLGVTEIAERARKTFEVTLTDAASVQSVLGLMPAIDAEYAHATEMVKRYPRLVDGFVEDIARTDVETIVTKCQRLGGKRETLDTARLEREVYDRFGVDLQNDAEDYKQPKVEYDKFTSKQTEEGVWRIVLAVRAEVQKQTSKMRRLSQGLEPSERRRGAARAMVHVLLAANSAANAAAELGVSGASERDLCDAFVERYESARSARRQGASLRQAIWSTEWLRVRIGVAASAGRLATALNGHAAGHASEDEAVAEIIELVDWMRTQEQQFGQRERVLGMIDERAGELVDRHCAESSPALYDLPGLASAALNLFSVTLDINELSGAFRKEVETQLLEAVHQRYREREQLVGEAAWRLFERQVWLQVIDSQWKDHLLQMDHLREGIGLRGYAQKDPLVEYKKESFKLFQAMLDRTDEETIRNLFFWQVTGDASGRPVLYIPSEDDIEDVDEEAPAAPAFSDEDRRAAQSAVDDFTRNVQRKQDKEMAGLSFAGGPAAASPKQPTLKSPKVGRNDLCPCGSGKKYKKCHGVNE